MSILATGVELAVERQPVKSAWKSRGWLIVTHSPVSTAVYLSPG